MVRGAQFPGQPWLYVETIRLQWLVHFLLLLTIMPDILRTTPVLLTTWSGEHLVLRTGIGGFLWKFLESN